MDSLGSLVPLFILLVIIVVAGVLYLNYRRSSTMLRNWASQNGYRIIQANMRYFFTGPFFWTTGKGQSVFRVEVENQQGFRRTGWVRCGSWIWGLIIDK